MWVKCKNRQQSSFYACVQDLAGVFLLSWPVSCFQLSKFALRNISPVHARPARTQTLFFWKPCSLQIQRCVAEQTFPRCNFWQCYLQGHPFSVMATFILTADILSFCFVGFDNIKIVSVASLPLPEDCLRYSAVKATHSFSNGPQNSLEGIWADLTVRKKPPSIFSRRRWETD